MPSVKVFVLSTFALFASANVLAGSVDDGVRDLQRRWAEVTYHAVDKNHKETGYEALEADAEKLVETYPDRAEPKIWAGIILSTHAGISGGFGALGKVKAAKKLFEQAIAIDDTALDGSAHTSLGSLYYQVPGWPLSFGDDGKAEQQLTRALQINPAGIDPNYFYGNYLYEQGRYTEAAEVLKNALAAPARPDRPLADAGRRQEVRALMDKVRGKLGG